MRERPPAVRFFIYSLLSPGRYVIHGKCGFAVVYARKKDDTRLSRMKLTAWIGPKSWYPWCVRAPPHPRRERGRYFAMSMVMPRILSHYYIMYSQNVSNIFTHQLLITVLPSFAPSYSPLYALLFDHLSFNHTMSHRVFFKPSVGTPTNRLNVRPESLHILIGPLNPSPQWRIHAGEVILSSIRMQDCKKEETQPMQPKPDQVALKIRSCS